jgi:hypothetical protein
LAILDAVDDNTKMILCSPNNPTGNSSFPMKVWLLYFKILKALWLLMKRICKKQSWLNEPGPLAWLLQRQASTDFV